MQSSRPGHGGGVDGGGPKPRFKTVLSSRNNDESPSDLEVEFRNVSDRVKVVTKSKLSGAHFHCLKEHMVIRAYYPVDLEELPPLSAEEDDFDGMLAFLRTFKLAIVLFVLPPHKPIFEQQLDNISSHFHRAQRLVGKLIMEGVDKNLRVLLVPDTKSAMNSVIAIADAFTPEVLQGKRNYFGVLREKNLVLQRNPQSHGLPPKADIPESYSNSARIRVAMAMEHLAVTVRLPDKEDNALLAFLGSLENIASADDATFEELPFLDRTRKIVQSFFGNPNVDLQRQRKKIPTESFRSTAVTIPRSATIPMGSGMLEQDAFYPTSEPYDDPFAGIQAIGSFRSDHDSEISYQEYSSEFPPPIIDDNPLSRQSVGHPPPLHHSSYRHSPQSLHLPWSSSYPGSSQNRFSGQHQYYGTEQSLHSRSAGWSRGIPPSAGHYSTGPEIYQDRPVAPVGDDWIPPGHAPLPPRLDHSFRGYPNTEAGRGGASQTHFSGSRSDFYNRGISGFQPRHASGERRRTTPHESAQYSSYSGTQAPFSYNEARR